MVPALVVFAWGSDLALSVRIGVRSLTVRKGGPEL